MPADHAPTADLPSRDAVLAYGTSLTRHLSLPPTDAVRPTATGSTPGLSRHKEPLGCNRSQSGRGGLRSPLTSAGDELQSLWDELVVVLEDAAVPVVPGRALSLADAIEAHD